MSQSPWQVCCPSGKGKMTGKKAKRGNGVGGGQLLAMPSGVPSVSGVQSTTDDSVNLCTVS